MDNAENRRADEAKDPTSEQDERESGMPGGGRGRRDEVGRSGVYPPGAEDIPPDAEIRMAGSWGGGDYEESGGSELRYVDGQLLGGTTAGKSGEPTIDIHGGAAGRGDEPRRDEGDAVIDSDSGVVDRQELMMRGLPPASNEEAGPGAFGEPTRRSSQPREPRGQGQEGQGDRERGERA